MCKLGESELGGSSVCASELARRQLDERLHNRLHHIISVRNPDIDQTAYPRISRSEGLTG